MYYVRLEEMFSQNYDNKVKDLIARRTLRKFLGMFEKETEIVVYFSINHCQNQRV